MPEHTTDAETRAQATLDLLGMLAFAELLAFDRMAADARLAPDLRCRALLSEMAGREIANYRRLTDRIVASGADPEAVMRPFVKPLQAYHEQTIPSDWYEGLTKAYFGDGIADDFAREIAERLEPNDRTLVLDVLHDSGHRDFVEAELLSAVGSDPALAGRLSMWARRLVGEGLSQAIRVAAGRPALTALLAAGAPDRAGEPVEPAPEVPVILKSLAIAHSERMSAIGLNS